ncbi:YggS family pyridoxal phosphate enzyme [Psychrosphaera saromensis]|uniref:Pyridoxal phosphate homeostasis protein n=1 Tax=Psychrosphaera saromensis TaxID=716813 RepID=A0A2S7UVN3_9GAMM|nr:YggS family pyridoxal phosphate-dependent enzyme [Psychrosphaera saromensis]PQJ54013.1 YggS family pyridoxal phosphate enzyme [Psychrosphaera saromensis]GHB76163.1 YggS family pyridoxal phosphate enzyme [Psychrosphaera saromensis]GLQ14494.1 YggS family pyridoxal phosphate enzyme [Psychrosphaera saromensis]
MSKNSDINNIATQLLNAQNNIENVAQKYNRSASAVTLMAVSKTKPVEDVVAAYNAGQRIFGENYAQELFDKHQKLSHLADIQWHYIGPIQSNKTKIICQSASWIDSVDRLKVANRIDTHAKELNKNINLLLQVNISNSPHKSGISLEQVNELAESINLLEHVTLRGLMAIPDNYDADEMGNRPKLNQEFNQMLACYSDLQQQYPSVDTLSLGMSGDLDIAIECGSTMVRLGTAIFGKRN